jgi:hypothetical protein
LLPVETSVPADFEPVSAVLLAVDALLPHHPHVLTGLVSALVDRVQVIAVITGEEQRRDLLTLLCDWGLPAHRVHAARSPAFAPWLRRGRPLFVRRNGRVYVERPADVDDGFPTELGPVLDAESRHLPESMAWGNLLNNGRGLALTTAAATPVDVDLIRRTLGLRHLRVLPLAHSIDRLATFVAPDTLLLATIDPADDPAAADLLDRAASELQGSDCGGGPLKVERIPAAPRLGDRRPTYADAILASDVVIVPAYAGANERTDRTALETYRRLLPDRKIVAVEASSLAASGLMLRSVALGIPVAHPPPVGAAQPVQTQHSRGSAFVTRQGWYGPRRIVMQMEV